MPAATTATQIKTGSMSPTIPQGSAALVREIGVNQVHVGDVVRVEGREETRQHDQQEESQ